jgi:ATP-dependent RNA helicase DDX58
LSLSHVVDVNDILVMTPQILLNALDRKEIDSLGLFSLLIFDECHWMMKNHPYNKIMADYYIDVLLSQTASATPLRLPQAS